MAEQRERREQGRAGGRKAWQPFVSKKRDVKNQKFGFGGRKKVRVHFEFDSKLYKYRACDITRARVRRTWLISRLRRE